MVFLVCLCGPAYAETLRIAAWNVGLSRDGPGLLLNDFTKETDEIVAIVTALALLDADVVLLIGFDNDYAGQSALALQVALANAGANYATVLPLTGNEGVPSGLDLDGDGRLNGWGDNWGFGKFQGHDSMILLSRLPATQTRRWADLRWADLPNATMPRTEDGPFPTPEIAAQLRLSSHAHWDVPLQTQSGLLHLFISNPTPPVFDGPEDANGLRNNDEIGFWLEYLSGTTLRDDTGNDAPFSGEPFIVIGDLNADPNLGDGLRFELRALLADDRLSDPAQLQTATAYWNGLPPMRVDYILPAATLQIMDGGTAAAVENTTTAHRIIWLDIALN